MRPCPCGGWFFTALRAWWRWTGLEPNARLVHLRTDRVQIDGSAPYQIDGDLGGHAPVTVRIASERARIVGGCGGTFAPIER